MLSGVLGAPESILTSPGFVPGVSMQGGCCCGTPQCVCWACAGWNPDQAPCVLYLTLGLNYTKGLDGDAIDLIFAVDNPMPFYYAGDGSPPDQSCSFISPTYLSVSPVPNPGDPNLHPWSEVTFYGTVFVLQWRASPDLGNGIPAGWSLRSGGVGGDLNSLMGPVISAVSAVCSPFHLDFGSAQLFLCVFYVSNAGSQSTVTYNPDGTFQRNYLTAISVTK